jgi:Bacterial type II/III secretion system short domain
MRPTCVTALILASSFMGVPAASQDVPPERAGPTSPFVEVIRLQHALAEEVGPVVTQLLGTALRKSARIIPDLRNNSIVVSGDEDDVKQVRAVVAMLDVAPTHGKGTAPARKSSASFELVLFQLPANPEALDLPRTATGVIDPSAPEAVLAKIRAAVGKGGVTEVAKLAFTAEESRPLKSRKSVQIPVVSGGRGATTFTGYQDAVLEFSVQTDSARGGSRRLGISCRIERFAEADKTAPGETDVVPPAKNSNTLEFSALADDGQLVMAAVESAAARNDGSYVLFVRVKG